jgi:putative transposase
MRAYQATYPVTTMARVLGVSTSGYHAWRGREPSERAKEDQKLLELIVKYHRRSRGNYGAPRIHQDLVQEEKLCVGLNRVARLMRAAGIQGTSRRRKPKTTKRDCQARPAPDLVDRDFTATGPDQLWVADITFVPTLLGFFYLAVVLDVWSRRIVGWAMENHLRTELVLAALDMAITRRRPKGVVHHSDQGCQYTSLAFGSRCKVAGVRPSMGSVGDCYDNAMCESFFATLECELLDKKKLEDKSTGKLEVFDFIEGWYNPVRRHSKIDYLSPMEYERRKLLSAA